MLPLGFEAKISAGERSQTYTLDREGHWDRHMLHIAS